MEYSRPRHFAVSVSLLTRIAGEFNSFATCNALGFHLFPDDRKLIDRLTDNGQCDRNPRKAALGILLEWSGRTHGSGANINLIKALQDVNRKAADKLGPLLQTGESIQHVRCQAVFKRATEPEYFYISVLGKPFGSVFTTIEKQRKDKLTTLFKHILKSDGDLVSISEHPVIDKAPLFCLVNVILRDVASLCRVELEELQRALVRQLEDLSSTKSYYTIQVHTVVSVGNTIQFITSIPHSEALPVLRCWSIVKNRPSLQRRFAELPFMKSSNPIVALTNQLDDEQWMVTEDTILSQSLTLLAGGSTILQSSPPEHPQLLPSELNVVKKGSLSLDCYRKDDIARTHHAAEQDEAGYPQQVERCTSGETDAKQILAKRLYEPDRLRVVADGLTSQFECRELATFLGVDLHRFVPEPVHSFALHILQEWLKASGDYASGQRLYSALMNIGRRDLADSLLSHLVTVYNIPNERPEGTAKPTLSSQEPIGIAETVFSNPQFCPLALSPNFVPVVQRLEAHELWKWYGVTCANCSIDADMNDWLYTFQEDSKPARNILDIFCQKSENKISEERKNIAGGVFGHSLLGRTPAEDVPHHIAIVGSSGAGKSTACRLLVSNISVGGLKERFSRVLYWDFRDFQVQEVTGITELLQIATQCLDATTCRRFAEELLASRGKGVLLIFDGLEQFSAANSLIWSLINGCLLSLSHVVVTTRPCGIVKELTDFVFYQLPSFSDAQLDEVMENRLGKQLPFKLKPALASLVRVPPIALAVCELFQEYPSYEPNTLTELISSIVAVALRRFTSDGGAFTADELPDQTQPAGVDGLCGIARTFLLNLAAISHKAFEKGQSVFDDASLRTHMTTDVDLDNLALLNRKESTPERNIYWFQHSAFQDFLAAVHFVQTLKEKNSGELAAGDIEVAAADIGTCRCKDFFWRCVSRLVDRSLHRVLFNSLISSLLVGGKNERLDQSSNFRLLLQCAMEVGDDDVLASASKCELIKRITLQRVTVVDIELLSSARFVTKSLRCIQLTFERQEGCSIRPKMQTQLQRWMSAAMEMLKACGSLTRLVIVGPDCQLFDSKGFSFLCDIVKADKLEWLWLSWSQLGDSRASKLACALRECTRLEYLDLQGNAIGNDGGIALAESLVHSQTLQQLFLTHNRYNELTRWRLARLYNISDRLI